LGVLAILFLAAGCLFHPRGKHLANHFINEKLQNLPETIRWNLKMTTNDSELSVSEVLKRLEEIKDDVKNSNMKSIIEDLTNVYRVFGVKSEGALDLKYWNEIKSDFVSLQRYLKRQREKHENVKKVLSTKDNALKLDMINKGLEKLDILIEKGQKYYDIVKQ
jgi:hypothetical protein